MHLKDLDLRTRLMRHRCSYLVQAPFFDGLDTDLRTRLLRDLDRSLTPGKQTAASRHLGDDEAAVIRTVLRATVPGFPAGAR